MGHLEDHKTIGVAPPQRPQAVFADLYEREAQALLTHAKFFQNPAHVSKVEQVEAIVDNFFAVKNAIYVNHRANGKNPFTVVKVERPQFPRMSQKMIDQLYRDPLKALGVEIVFSKNTNSYLYRIR